MAMRRPKKMSRSGGTPPAISRLGPGIETVDVRFTPTMGWEKEDVLSNNTCGETRSSPWLISWEVGLGTSVDRGLRLAKLRRSVVPRDGRGDGETEHFVLAPREGILSEILIPSGEEVCPPLEQRPRKAENVATAKDAAPEDAASAKILEQGERWKPPHPDKGLQGSVQAAGVAVHAGVSSSCQEAVVVGRLSFCGHPELHGNLCTSCGRRVITTDETTTGVGEVSTVNGSHSGAIGVPKRGIGIGGAWDGGVYEGRRDRVAPMAMAKVTMKGGSTLTMSSTAARKMHIDKAERLLSTRRLSLVLDLDNTLLHCSDHPDARRIVVPGVDGIHPIHLPNQPRGYYIKLRPGLRRFLAEAATMFEMTIYTAGTSQYADAVAKVLDPDRSLFQGRHFSTCYTPDLGRNTKSLERIFPCGLDMALIVDDRDDVWRGQQANNLLLVRPYKFFVGQRNVPGGPTHDPGVQPPPERQAMEISETSRTPSPAEGTSGNNDSHDPEPKAASKSEPEAKSHTKERGSKTESEWKPLVKLNSKLQSNSESATESKSESISEPTPASTVKAALPQNSEPISESNSDPKSASEPKSVSQLISVSESKSSSVSKSVPGANSLSESKSASKPNGKDASHVPNSPPKTSAVESDAPGAMDSYPARKSSPSTTLGAASEDADKGIVETDDGVERSGGKLSEPGAISEGVGGDSDGDGVGRRTGKSALSAVAGELGKGVARMQRQRRLAWVLQQRRQGRSPAQAASQDSNVATGEGVLSPVGVGESGNRDNSDKGIKAATAATVGPAAGEQASSLSPAEEDSAHGGGKEDPDPCADPPGKRAELPRTSELHPAREVAAKENDPQLDCTLETLKAVHAEFFAAENDRGRDRGQRRDVASFLAKTRSRVLKGVRMVFSGVIPVSGAPVDPRTHRLWKLAETHGAIVGNEIDKYTTHVVAVRLGTAKTKKGLRMPGVFVVHLDWLLNSMWHCRREKETMFLLAGRICAGSPPVPPQDDQHQNKHQNKHQNDNKRDSIRTISASNQDARVSTRVLSAECSGTLLNVRPRETSDCVSDTVNAASIDAGVDIIGERPRKRLRESDGKGGLRESTSRRSSAALAAGWGGDDCKNSSGSSSSNSMDDDSSESDLADLIDELER